MFVQNIRIFVFKNRLLFSIIVLCVICSSIMIYISAGLIYHYQKKSFLGGSSKQSVTINFNETACLDDPITKGELVKFFENGNIFDDLEGFYCETNQYDNDGNIIYNLTFYAQYKNGKFGFNKKTEQDFKKDMVLKEGVFFTEEQYSSGENVAIVADINAFKKAKRVNVFGKSYSIIGKLNPYQGYYLINDIYIPFTSLDENQPLEWGLYFEYNKTLNKNDVRQLISYAHDCFGDRIMFDDYNSYYDFDLSKYYMSLCFSCVLICLLSAFNFILLYRYILSTRINEYRILRICGATRLKLAIEFTTEVLTLSFPVLIIGAVAFEVIIKKYIILFYEHSLGAYGIRLYLIVIFVYLITTVISSMLMFFVHLAKRMPI